MRGKCYLKLFLVALASLIGCAGSHSNKVQVSGTATFGGEPIERGDIVLLAVEGDAAPDAGKITDGKFSFPAAKGKKRVEIHASRPGPPDNEMGSPTRIDYIPARYNANSTLTATVSANSNDNSFSFVLTEK